MSLSKHHIYRLSLALGVGILSGTVSAFSLDPVMQVFETVARDDLFGLLSSFAATAGLSFGVAGAAFLVAVLRHRALTGGVFLLTSMIGMAAAVYVAILAFDNSLNSFMVPYGLASPLGALIVAGPVTMLGQYVRRWRTLGLAMGIPSVWAVGVAAVVGPDAALEVSGLAALYIGWQASVLAVFATARRA